MYDLQRTNNPKAKWFQDMVQHIASCYNMQIEVITKLYP